MKIFTSLTCFLVALTTFTALPADADACSPPLPGLVYSIPKSGETYPANAALYFHGYEISLDAITVTVDGQLATLVAAPDVQVSGALTARVSPEPLAGQTVEIEGTFCPESMCEPSAISFTAGAPDTEAPASPTNLSFSVYDHADFVSSGGDCQYDTDLTYYLHVDIEPAKAGQSLQLVRVTAFRDASFEKVAFTEADLSSGSKAYFRSAHTVSVLDGKPAPEAFCFRASVRDVAGNVAPDTVEVCKPCFYRKDDLGGTSSFVEEPEWASADVHPGGPCDDGSGIGGSGGEDTGSGGNGGAGGGGDDDLAVTGCGCQLPGGGSGGSAIAMLALLAGSVMARRRPRRAPR